MKNMVWCNCKKCNHKLFLYNPSNADVEINIKCSSCKRIMDVEITDGKAEVREHEEA